MAMQLSFACQNLITTESTEDTEKRRYLHVTEFAAQSTGSIHRKGREERKAQPQKSLNSEEVIRTGTRMPRIARIGTDTIIRVRSSDPFFSVNDINRKISHQRLFYPVIEHEGGAMSMELERIFAESAPARGWRNLFGDGIATEKIVTITFHVGDHHRRRRLSMMTAPCWDE